MALTTGQREDINTASPINRKYNIGSRLTYMTTASRLIPPSDTGTYTTNYECSTAGATSLYIPNQGMYYCTGTGYYTIQKPEEIGQELIILTRGTTDQYFRSASAGSGTTVCTIAAGTGTTYVMLANTALSHGILHLRAMSTNIWILMNATNEVVGGTAHWAVTTSSG